MDQQNYHLINIGYVGEPSNVGRTVQDNPEIMKKIEADAQEKGGHFLLVVEGNELCGSTNLFGVSVWNDPEEARKFFNQNPNVDILAKKAGISRFTTKSYRILDRVKGAFQTEQMKGLTELVGAGTSR